MNNICVFCGSSSGFSKVYADTAKELGTLLAEQKRQLIYGGGNVGLMGIIADQVMNSGGKVTGVIPHFLFDMEVGHEGLTELIRVNSMHERKLKMSELSDGFIAMPGGFGTLEELAEILTWVQLALIQKPVGLLNVNGFFSPLVAQFELMVQEGFLRRENYALLNVHHNPETLLQMMNDYTPTDTKKWITSSQT